MQTPQRLAKHLREACFGGNWTEVSFEDAIAGVSWDKAIRQSKGTTNTIAGLVYHIHYYMAVQILVMESKSLSTLDKSSFGHPTIHSEQDWQELLRMFRSGAEKWISLVEQMPETELEKPFRDGQHGDWFRNLMGVIEHTYYHVGQIMLLKKNQESQE